MAIIYRELMTQASAGKITKEELKAHLAMALELHLKSSRESDREDGKRFLCAMEEKRRLDNCVDMVKRLRDSYDRAAMTIVCPQCGEVISVEFDSCPQCKTYLKQLKDATATEGIAHKKTWSERHQDLWGLLVSIALVLALIPILLVVRSCNGWTKTEQGFPAPDHITIETVK